MPPRGSSSRSGDGDDTDRPVLITHARRSYEEELAIRKRRYFLLMSVRFPALILAMIAFLVWHNGWVSMAIIAVSIPIPWIAVIGANDRLARDKTEVRGYAGGGAPLSQGFTLPAAVTGAPHRTDEHAAGGGREKDPDPDLPHGGDGVPS